MTQLLLPKSNLNNINYSTNNIYSSKTWLIDSDNRILGFTNGKYSIQQSIQSMLQTPRYDYLIYSWNYGNELSMLIGKDKAYIEVEAPRLIKECLLQDDRISEVDNFSFADKGDGVLIKFEAITNEGVIESEVTL